MSSTIALLTNSLPNVGQGRYAYELYSNLRRMKANVDLLYLGRRWREGKTIEKVNFPKIFDHFLNYEFIFPRRIPSYALYHFTNDFLCRLLKHKSPAIISVLDLSYFKYKRSAPFLARWSLRKSFKYLDLAEKIITISKSTKRDLIEIFDIDPTKISVIYLGVDHKVFHPRDKEKSRKKLGLPMDKKIILNVGTETKIKNIDGMIEIFDQIQKESDDIVLVRAGGTLAKEVTKMIRDKGLEKKIIRKSVPSKNLPYYYSAADVHLSLDKYAGFGLPLVEAMACGCPVIASKIGAFEEVVGKDGMLVNHLDQREVINSVLKLLENEKLREKFRERGLKRAKKFSWEKTARETLKIYKQVLEGK